MRTSKKEKQYSTIASINHSMYSKPIKEHPYQLKGKIKNEHWVDWLFRNLFDTKIFRHKAAGLKNGLNRRWPVHPGPQRR